MEVEKRVRGSRGFSEVCEERVNKWKGVTCEERARLNLDIGLGLVYPDVEGPTWSFAFFQEKILLASLLLEGSRGASRAIFKVGENHLRIYKHPHPLLQPKLSSLCRLVGVVSSPPCYGSALNLIFVVPPLQHGSWTSQKGGVFKLQIVIIRVAK